MSRGIPHLRLEITKHYKERYGVELDSETVKEVRREIDEQLNAMEEQEREMQEQANEDDDTVTTFSIRCTPFEVKPFHFLQPPKRLLHEDFLSLWQTYNSSFSQTTIFSHKLDKRTAIDIG